LVPELMCSFEQAKEMVVREGWEGLVLYHKNFVNTFRLDGGEPKRPDGCYKWKPIQEGDFIAKYWIPNKKDPNRLKEIALFQINKKTGKEFPCYKLGSFKAKMREELRNKKYPFVVEVKYEMRFASGKIRNARFVRLRPDKKPSECVVSL